MDDGSRGGHAGSADRLVESVGTLLEILNRIGGSKITGLAVTGADQILGGHTGSLDIVDQHTVHRKVLEIAVQ